MEIEKHLRREAETENADWSRIQRNVFFKADETPLSEKVAKIIGDRKGRKDAVIAIQVVLGMSPEAAKTVHASSFGRLVQNGWTSISVRAW